jgi:hypothetical protein
MSNTISSAGGSSVAHFAQSTEALALELGGDPAAQLAALALKMSHDSREAGQAARSAEEQNILEHQGRQIEALHAQADAIRAAGWARGLAQIGSGGLQVAGGLSTLSNLPKTELQAVTVGAESKVFTGSADVLAGGGEIIGSSFDARAQEHAAAATAANHRAEAGERRLDGISEELAAARELARDAIDFLREARGIQNSTEQAPVNAIRA